MLLKVFPLGKTCLVWVKTCLLWVKFVCFGWNLKLVYFGWNLFALGETCLLWVKFVCFGWNLFTLVENSFTWNIFHSITEEWQPKFTTLQRQFCCNFFCAPKKKKKKKKKIVLIVNICVCYKICHACYENLMCSKNVLLCTPLLVIFFVRSKMNTCCLPFLFKWCMYDQVMIKSPGEMFCWLMANCSDMVTIQFLKKFTGILTSYCHNYLQQNALSGGRWNLCHDKTSVIFAEQSWGGVRSITLWTLIHWQMQQDRSMSRDDGEEWALVHFHVSSPSSPNLCTVRIWRRLTVLSWCRSTRHHSHHWCRTPGHNLCSHLAGADTKCQVEEQKTQGASAFQWNPEFMNCVFETNTFCFSKSSDKKESNRWMRCPCKLRVNVGVNNWLFRTTHKWKGIISDHHKNIPKLRSEGNFQQRKQDREALTHCNNLTPPAQNVQSSAQITWPQIRQNRPTGQRVAHDFNFRANE